QFKLNLIWMNPHDPTDMAKQLKLMEVNTTQLKPSLFRVALASQSLEKLAPAYWAAIKECL
ncbi:MAG: hypothetical protein V4805_11695, partial [Pseudomonadota bacterium]